MATWLWTKDSLRNEVFIRTKTKTLKCESEAFVVENSEYKFGFFAKDMKAND